MSLIATFRVRLAEALQTLPPVRPLSKETLDAVILRTLFQTEYFDKHAEWECVFRRQMLLLTMEEADALETSNVTYYQNIDDLLDLALSLSEKTCDEIRACDASLPLLMLEDAFETQTIESCMRTFSWLETRRDRVTIDMDPSKGKGPNLLRSLNNLLRRISKTGSTTQFCGRILIFLSSVFPFGERSGVNLRGEYGPAWVPVANPTSASAGEVPAMEDVILTSANQSEPNNISKSDIQRPEFYNTFWSLQTYFSRPQSFADKSAFPMFRSVVESVMGVLAEATKKEQNLMGGSGNSKSQRPEQQTMRGMEDLGAGLDYFFAKFLTSPELLEFELADTLFRRQILVQLLILIRHLITFSQREKSVWVTKKNSSLQLDFTLSEADDRWARDMYSRAMSELQLTAPEGKSFADTISIILDRDRNWVRWKNEVCPPMDVLARVARQQRTEAHPGKTDAELAEESHAIWDEVFRRNVPLSAVEANSALQPYGSDSLEEVWLEGVRDIQDLEEPQEPATLESLHKQIKGQEMRKETMRRKKGLPIRSTSTVTQPGSSTSLPPATSQSPSDGHLIPISTESETKAEAKPAVPPRNAFDFELVPREEDPALNEFDLQKQSYTWLALRLGIRQGQLQHFGKINGSDISLLLEEIKKAATAPSGSPPLPIDASNVAKMDVDDASNDNREMEDVTNAS